MHVSNSLKMAYVKIPKTGGTAVRKILACADFKSVYGRHSTLQRVPYPARYKDFHIFTIVRNPYDRLISMYRFECMKGNMHSGTFMEFVAADHTTPKLQWDYVQHPSLKCQVLKYEHGAHDAVRQMVGNFEPIETGARVHDLGTYSRREWSSAGGIDWITDHCSEDFKRFGYKPTTWNEL